MKRLWCLVGILICFTLSCSSSGSSSGSGGNILGSNATYKKEDLAGTWNYSARQQGGSNNCTGTMTFDQNVHLTGISNSCCPGGQQLNRSEFWFWDYGFVKAYNYAWCNDPYMLMKYAMNFQGSDKRTIVGLLDVHERVEANYTRFDITLTSQAPVPVTPPPIDPGINPALQGKKPVRTAGLSTVPSKK